MFILANGAQATAGFERRHSNSVSCQWQVYSGNAALRNMGKLVRESMATFV
jgi:hypothetical protein